LEYILKFGELEKIVFELVGVTSGIIEGCMNTIKVLKRTAWGFRDFEYFFLRIKYTFLPYALKEKVKDKLFRNCSEYLLPPIDHQKCG